MHTRKLALAAALAVCGVASVGFAPQAPAAGFSISVGVPPPPLRVETPPPPRAGYAWAPGYWRWSGHRYIWVGGAWHRNRAGYVYVAPRWEHRGNRWYYHQSSWNHDPNWHGHRGWDHDHH